MEVRNGFLNRKREVRRWVFGVSLLALIMGTALYLFTRVIIHGFSQGHYASMSSSFTKFMDLKNMIMGISMGEIPSQNHEVEAKRLTVSPNLSTCHLSFPRPDLSIYCCPPKPESEEPFIDFQFPPPSAPLRLRRPAHLLTDDYIQKYRKAVSIMNSLPYDDPRSFRRQADLHCIYCTGAYNQQNSDIPLEVHRSWLFFPWHRMMLYFHERMLGDLIGDDSFALHFWNWDNPAGMVIPEMYLEGSLFDDEREISHLPPKMVELNYDLFAEKEWGGETDKEEKIKMNLAFMYNQMVSGAKTTELFMGCSYKGGDGGDCDGPGTIEEAPHNTLHDWIGNSVNTGRENMGSFYSAGRDPIFYCHHSNNDRLWEIWRKSHSDITDTDWLDSHFFFHDEKKQLVRIKIRDILNITKLRYGYEEVPLPWLTARPQPSVAPKIARDLLKQRDHDLENYKHSNDYFFGPNGRAINTTVTVKVQRPKKQRNKREEEVLVVYGIDMEKEKYVKVDVYVNVVDETTLLNPNGGMFREFAGTFVNIPHGARHVMRRKTTLKLGISELLQDLEADKDESIWVSLVPRAQDYIHLTIEGVRIEYIQY